LKGIFVVGTGSAIIQVIGLIATPIISRLYLPADFGIVAVYISILAVLVGIASYRYEFGLPLAKDDTEAANLLALCSLVIIINSLILALILYIGGKIFESIINLDLLRPYLWLIILSFIGMGCYQILNYWAIRKRDYQRITYTKILQRINGSSVKIILGLFKFGPLGLLFGEIASQVSGIGILFKTTWQKDKSSFKDISFKGIKSAARKYLNFPLFSGTSTIFNTLTFNIPVFFLLSFYGVQVVGWYSFAFEIMVIPTSLLSISLSQVYFGEIAELLNEDPKKLKSFYISLVKKLFLISSPLIGILAILAPIIFPIIFGQAWQVSGYYCLPLAIPIIFTTVFSSISILNYTKFNYLVLLFDIFRVSLIILSFYAAKFLNAPPIIAIACYGLMLSFTYIVNFALNLFVFNQLIKIKEIGNV
jgi:O-antigen/teichoic acid export membrane protein